MKSYDAAVIGGGVLGCFAARNLRRWDISTVLIEAKEDICTGVSRANSAIIYSGCDHRYGSLKAAMSVRVNAAFEQLCEELELPFSRCGSLMTATGPKGEAVLQKKLDQGLKNGVPGLKILSGDEARELEPMLSPAVTAALYAPSTGAANPWQMCIAAYENALHNGCDVLLNAPVRAIHRDQDGYVLETDGEDVRCRAVINCAGMQADRIQEMIFEPSVRIHADASDYIMLEEGIPAPTHIIMEERESGKGMSAVPTVEGRLMLVSPARELKDVPYATDAESLDRLRILANELLPGLDVTKTLRSFAAIRPNPYRVENPAEGIHGFAIENPGPGFYSLIGVKTPGLTCAEELGLHLAGQAAHYLSAEINGGFDPKRRSIPNVRSMDFAQRAALADGNPDFADVVCLCQDITRGEIIEAVRRGAVNADGVKRRIGSSMGACQGNRCRAVIEEIIRDVLEGMRNGKL